LDLISSFLIFRFEIESEKSSQGSMMWGWIVSMDARFLVGDEVFVEDVVNWGGVSGGRGGDF
jgi:hypothetical protein